MLGEIAWALLCGATGWYCRGRFGSVGALYAAGKKKWDEVMGK